MEKYKKLLENFGQRNRTNIVFFTDSFRTKPASAAKKANNFKKTKMIGLILIIAAILSIIIWDKFLDQEIDNTKIPASNNKTYQIPKSITPSDVVDQINQSQGKPILLYIYTTWCSVCKAQTPIVNQIARQFQNTDLKLIILAVDNNINGSALFNYLTQHYQNIYFQPQYLAYKENFEALLNQKAINYNKIIPFTAIINREGRVETKFNGYKGQQYIMRKLLKFYK